MNIAMAGFSEGMRQTWSNIRTHWPSMTLITCQRALALAMFGPQEDTAPVRLIGSLSVGASAIYVVYYSRGFYHWWRDGALRLPEPDRSACLFGLVAFAACLVFVGGLGEKEFWFGLLLPWKVLGAIWSHLDALPSTVYVQVVEGGVVAVNGTGAPCV